VKEYIEHRAGNIRGLKFHSQEYRPCRLLRLLSMALTAFQYAVMALVLFQPALVMRFLPLSLAALVEQSKFPVLLGLFFGGSILISSLNPSNAFEIFVGGQQAFSALQSGRMPQVADVAEVIRLLEASSAAAAAAT